MKLKSCFCLFLFTLMTQSLYGNNLRQIQYISPAQNSVYNSRTSPVIIRPGQLLDRSSIDFNSQIQVTNSKGKKIPGDILLSSEGKTLIFKPFRSYEPSDYITVHFNKGMKKSDGDDIPSFSWSFQVTSLQQPVSSSLYRELHNPAYTLMDSKKMAMQKATVDELPDNFPNFSVTIDGTPADGHLFISPTNFTNGYNVMVNDTGGVAYYERFDDTVPVDFKKLPNGMLSYGGMYEFHLFVGGGPTIFYMMDSTYTIIDQFEMGNGYEADSHEFQLLPNGHVLMLGYDLQPVDMSQIVEGGHPGAMVAGSIIQELDASKNVIFQWRSWDYFDLTDSYQDLTLTLFDAVHVNSIDLDNDNNLLLSTMGLGEITKVNRQTGEIIWRMGGKNNEFTFINEDETWAPNYFMYQHDVRRIENGNITLFDGGEQSMRPWSRAVEYKVDETAKTAEKVWEYRPSPDIFTSTMGSVQRLSNGNTLIGWGMASLLGRLAVTEVDADNNEVLKLRFDNIGYSSYRAMKFEWDGGQPAATVLRYEFAPGNSYTFDDPDNETGMTLEFSTIQGFGYNEARAKRYNYAPLQPQFAGKSPIIFPARVTIGDIVNLDVFTADMLFDVDFYGFEDPSSIIVYHREFEGRGFFIPLPTIYNHVTNEIQATITQFGEFAFGYADAASSTWAPLLIYPADSADVDNTKDIPLEWSPAGYANHHHIQVATDNAFTNVIADEEWLRECVYDFTPSDSDPAEYFWRVRTTNDAGKSDWTTYRMFNATAPYIDVTTPDGGEAWQLGLKHFILWDDIVDEDVIIELYKDGGLVNELATTYSSGGYQWKIPVNIETGSAYQINIKSAANPDINGMSASTFSIIDTVTAVPGQDLKVTDFHLYPNYPNPFNHQTRIRYQLPVSGFIKLNIYDAQGRIVQKLVNAHQSAGLNEVYLDASDLASGIYFYKLEAGNGFTQTRKLLLMK